MIDSKKSSRLDYQKYHDSALKRAQRFAAAPSPTDWYTNNGSLYMTSMMFMPLGLPANHPFWADAPQPWTQVKAWGGQPFPKDHRWNDDIQTRDKW